MSAGLNKSLEECEAQARALVKEMHQYKAAKDLNQRSSDALDKVSASINRVVQEIKPLTGRRFRFFVILQSVAWVLTTVLVAAMFVLMLMKKL